MTLKSKLFALFFRLKTSISVKEILLVFLSLAFVICLIEVVLRILEPRTNLELKVETIFLPSGQFYTALVPNQEGLELGHEVTINADGYRGKLVTNQKPKGTIRIAIFGDSHTFGVGASDTTTYPAILEQQLNGVSNRNFEVLNFGIGGYQLNDSLVHARKRAFEYAPDIILITYHGGDLLGHDSIIIDSKSQITSSGNSSKSVDFEPGNIQGENNVSSTSMKRGFWEKLKEYERSVSRRSIFAMLLTTYLKDLLRTLGVPMKGALFSSYTEIVNNGAAWKAAKKDILSFKRICERKKIRLGFVLMPSIISFEGHPATKLHQSLYNWLTSHKVPTLDLLPNFTGKDAKKLRASNFNHHPNPDAYRIAATGVAQFINDFSNR